MNQAARADILVFENVRKSYGRLVALDGVSFKVRETELVGLLGPNGAGKSTLFQIAAGLFAPDAGTVRLFGRSYRQDSSFVLEKLGVVFQARSLDLDMTVKANLQFHGGLFGLFGSRLRARITAVTETMEIADLIDKPVRALSGGNQRRVEVARALLSEPQLLLLDEPSVGLDAAARNRFVAHMRGIGAREGTAILWATHLVDEVEDADRIVLLKSGRVLGEGTPADMIANSGASDLTGAYIALTGAPASQTSEKGTRPGA